MLSKREIVDPWRDSGPAILFKPLPSPQKGRRHAIGNQLEHPITSSKPGRYIDIWQCIWPYFAQILAMVNRSFFIMIVYNPAHVMYHIGLKICLLAKARVISSLPFTQLYSSYRWLFLTNYCLKVYQDLIQWQRRLIITTLWHLHQKTLLGLDGHCVPNGVAPTPSHSGDFFEPLSLSPSGG